MPLSAIAIGEPGALLVTDMLPLALPADPGANLAVTEVFWPARIVTGTVSPLMLKPGPVTLAAEIVTLAVPVFDNVIGTDPLLPTRRLPKFTVEGFADRAPCVPVPVKATAGSEALLVIEMLPELTTVVVGSKTAEKVVFCPAVKVMGVEMPDTENPAPVAVTCVTVTLAFPVFVSVIVWLLLTPTTTLPKLMLPGFAVRVAPTATPVPASVRVCGELGPLSVKTILPVDPPATVGAN